MARLGAAFVALLLPLLLPPPPVTGTSAVSCVSPSTDASIKCENLRVTVSWECGQYQQPTSFKVTIIGGSQGSLEVETKACHYDLSSFLWESESRYMDIYHVTVEAVEGSKQSRVIMSRKFSFNMLETVDDRCSLDFPPVEIKQKDSVVLVSFPNPFHFYPELRLASKHQRAKFSFSILVNSSHFRGSCSTKDKTCKGDIHFTAGEEECVTLEGTLFDGFNFGQIPFKKTKRICKSEEPNVLIYVVPLVVAVFLILVALAICCKVKAWIMKSEPLPKPLVLDSGRQHQSYHHVAQTDISTTRLTVKPPVSLAEEEEEEEEEQLQEPELGRQDSSSSSSDGGGWRDKYVVRSRCSADYFDSGSNQLDTRSTSVCSDNSEESPYDCPHVFVDLGDGELADGYRE